MAAALSSAAQTGCTVRLVQTAAELIAAGDANRFPRLVPRKTSPFVGVTGKPMRVGAMLTQAVLASVMTALV